MSGTEQFILSALILAVTLLGAVLIPICIQRLPANYLDGFGRPPSAEAASSRGLRTAAGALFLLAGATLLPRWPIRAILILLAGLGAASFPGKHLLLRRLLRVQPLLDFVNGLRDSGNVTPLQTNEPHQPYRELGGAELELDIREELAKKLAEVGSKPSEQGKANDRWTPVPEPSDPNPRLEFSGSPNIGEQPSKPQTETPVDDGLGRSDDLLPRLSSSEELALRAREAGVSVDSMTLSQASLATPYLRDPGEAANAFSFDAQANSRSGYHSNRNAFSPPRRSPTQSIATVGGEVQYADGDPLFTAYLAVGWNAGSRPVRGKNSIWWCSIERRRNGKVSCELKNPATRVKALEQLGDLFSDWVARGVSGVAGFDFPFGFPRGFGAAMGVRIPRWRGSWELIAGRIRDEQIGRKWNNRFDVANSLNKMLPGDGPFWAHPPGQEFDALGRSAPKNPTLPMQRHCDEFASETSSLWRMAYAGSSGGQAMMGIPYVQHISTAIELEDAVSVWPFDLNTTKPVVSLQPRIIIAEVHPAMIEPFDDAEQPPSANRVRALAEHFERLDRAGELAPLLGVPDELPDDIRQEVVTEEGWILGMPAPDPSHWE